MKNKIITTVVTAQSYAHLVSFGWTMCANTVIIQHNHNANKALKDYVEFIEKIIGKEEQK